MAAGWVALGTAYAVDPARDVSQYLRDRWGPEDGAPAGPIYAISQTKDGYLWIGAESGLYRFDGFQFRQITNASGTIANILGLEVDDRGDMWVRQPGPAMLRYHDGEFEDAISMLGMPFSNVTALSALRDGGLLIARLEEGTVTYRDGVFETSLAAAPLARSPVIAVAQTGDGDVWLGTRDAGLYRVRGREVSTVAGLPDTKINCLLPDGDQALWVGTDRGIARWNGAEMVSVATPASWGEIRALAMAHDRDGNVWVGTNSSGVLRLNADGVVALPGEGGEAVTAVFEDREGNLWMGSASGLERLRDSAFVTYSSFDGLPPSRFGPVFADQEDRVWFAPREGGLFWMRGEDRGRVAATQSDDEVYSIAGGSGEIWIGRKRGGLARLRPKGGGFQVETLTQADGLAQENVYAVHVGHDGSVWAGTLSGGVSRFRDGAFTTYTVGDGLPSNTVTAILDDSHGTIWIATPSGLASLSEGGVKVLTHEDGLPSDNVLSLFEDTSETVWIGTTQGLAFRQGSRIQAAMPDSAAGSPLNGRILGMAQDGAGWLWVATADRVVRVDSRKLLEGGLEERDIREFAGPDGLRDVRGVRRFRSVVSDRRGRVWLSLERGLSVADPARLRVAAEPSIPQLETIEVDGKPLSTRDPIEIPAGARRVAISYAGLNLSAPERVRFRYRLDGFDPDWSQPTADREVVYTNLSPREYRFRVMASNGDGVWNGGEQSIGLQVEPQLWQTLWFRLALLIACILGALAFYRMRIHEVTRQLNMRFEERLAERTRIAQDLHDTLLQGFLSASMQLHVTADQLPDESPAKPRLNRVLALMGRVIEEGRNTVRGLRTLSDHDLNLEQAFLKVEEELGHGETGFRVIVEGPARPLHPVLRDEVYRIGREAIANALRHAEAKRIEVEIEFGPRRFRVLVRDDGRGIDPDVLASGREGHWGLRGMRERAERIGARLSVWSKIGAGTEVELSMPNSVALHGSGGKPEPVRGPVAAEERIPTSQGQEETR